MKRKRRMWLMILLGAVVALLVVLPLVGLNLPERYRAKGSATLDLPPAEVWAMLVDVEQHPMSASMCKGVELLEEDGSRWREKMSGSSLTYTTEKSDAPRFLERSAEDSVVPMTAHWDITLEETPDGGTRIWVEVDMSVRRGTFHVPIFRIMLSMFRGHERGVEAYLRSVSKDVKVTWER